MGSDSAPKCSSLEPVLVRHIYWTPVLWGRSAFNYKRKCSDKPCGAIAAAVLSTSRVTRQNNPNRNNGGLRALCKLVCGWKGKRDMLPVHGSNKPVSRCHQTPCHLQTRGSPARAAQYGWGPPGAAASPPRHPSTKGPESLPTPPNTWERALSHFSEGRQI